MTASWGGQLVRTVYCVYNNYQIIIKVAQQE